MIKRPSFNLRNKILCLYLLLSAGAGMARPPDQRVNMREGCRQAISGGYLKIYDEREAARLYIKTIAASLADVTQALTVTRKRYAKEREAADGEGYDLQKSVTADQTATEIRTLESRAEDYKDMQAKAEATYSQLIATEKALRTGIEFVFRFDRTEDKPDGGYPLKLEYKTACSKYRHLCPLPKKEAAKLLDIKLDGATPEECRRYASQSQIGN